MLEKRSSQRVSLDEMLRQLVELLALPVALEPEVDLREGDRHGIEVHAVEALLGDERFAAPREASSSSILRKGPERGGKSGRKLAEHGFVASFRGAGQARFSQGVSEEPTGLDKEVPRAHRRIEDADLEDFLRARVLHRAPLGNERSQGLAHQTLDIGFGGIEGTARLSTETRAEIETICGDELDLDHFPPSTGLIASPTFQMLRFTDGEHRLETLPAEPFRLHPRQTGLEREQSIEQAAGLFEGSHPFLVEQLAQERVNGPISPRKTRESWKRRLVEQTKAGREDVRGFALFNDATKLCFTAVHAPSRFDETSEITRNQLMPAIEEPSLPNFALLNALFDPRDKENLEHQDEPALPELDGSQGRIGLFGVESLVFPSFDERTDELSERLSRSCDSSSRGGASFRHSTFAGSGPIR